MLTAVSLYGVAATASGVFVRLRVYGQTGTTVAERAMTEDHNGASAGLGVYDWSGLIDLPDSDLTLAPLSIEARECATNDAAGFDASTTVLYRDKLGYVRYGVLYPGVEEIVQTAGSTATGPIYCTQDDIEALFGTKAIAKYADKDGDKDPAKIANRITRATIVGSNQVNLLLRGGVYTVPLDFTPNGGIIDDSINEAAATFAGVWLYRSNGDADVRTAAGEVGERYRKWCDDIEKQVLMIRGGLRQLVATRVKSGSQVYVPYCQTNLTSGNTSWRVLADIL